MKRIIIEKKFDNSHIEESPIATAGENQTLLKVKSV